MIGGLSALIGGGFFIGMIGAYILFFVLMGILMFKGIKALNLYNIKTQYEIDRLKVVTAEERPLAQKVVSGIENPVETSVEEVVEVKSETKQE